MDTITHGLAGYAVAKTGLTRDTGRWGVIAGVTASVFPDVDNLLRSFYGTEFILKHHRGLTNSVLLVVPFSLLFAWLFAKISGKRRDPSSHFPRPHHFFWHHDTEPALFLPFCSRLGLYHRPFPNWHFTHLLHRDHDLAD